MERIGSDRDSMVALFSFQGGETLAKQQIGFADMEDGANPNFDGMSEIGLTGLRRWGGYVYDEFLPELFGIYGVQKYREMADNDATIGAILFSIEMLLRQTDWSVQPYSSATEDVNAADFIESCMGDMSHTWADLISEVLSMLQYGWSYHEIVYKRRMGKNDDPTKSSKFNDGLIGWRKIPIRAQHTLIRWKFDESGGIQGMWQSAPPNYELNFIPIEKSLLFRTRTNRGDPQGRSILRNAYRSWYFKKRMEVIEGIGVERDLAGLPMITAPEDVDIWNSNDPEMVQLRQQANYLVQNVRRDELEGITMPDGWKFELLTTGGRRQMDVNAIIQRYDQRIAMTVLGDFILLGHEQVGSMALAVSKSDIFLQAIRAWLDMIEEIFNRYAIPRLFALNPTLPQENLPMLKHGEITAPNLQEMSNFISTLMKVGALTPGPELEEYLRSVAKLPEQPEGDGEGE